MSLFRAVATVGTYTMASRCLGFVRDALIAAILGVSGATDAFFVAFKLPNFFRRFFAEGAFNAAFVPLFSGWLVKRGHDWAKTSAEHTFAVLLTTLIVLVASFELAMPWVIKLLAPGFTGTPARYLLTIDLARITFPYILFISLAAFFAGILNSFDKYAAAAGTPIILNVCMITALGIAYFSPGQDAFLLAWGVFFAGLGQLYLLWRCSKKIGMDITFRKPVVNKEVKRLVKLGIPGAIGAGVVQIDLLINLMFASVLPTGAVSYLFYADRLNQLPLGVIGIAVTTALLPQLSKAIKAGHMKTTHHLQNRALEFALALTLPSAVALLILASPFVQILFERGEFSSADTHATAMTLMAYVLGLPAYVLVKILAVPFFARKDTTTPVVTASICVGVSITLNFLLISPLAYVGLALSTSLAAWVNVMLLTYYLRKRGWLRLSDSLKFRIPRLALSAAVMGILLWQTSLALEGWLAAGVLYNLLFLLVIISEGILAYGAAVLLLKVFEIAEIRSVLRRV